ncbi:MAG TPA: hypothetical protein VGG70_00505, partial [Candidatus Cybelea sp.]
MTNVLRFGFAGIIILGAIVALPNVPVFASEVVAQAHTPTPIPPTVIPAWIPGGGNIFAMCCNDVDPGATPDQHLFAGIIDGSQAVASGLGTNCPGVGSGGGNASKCNPYKYISMLALLCANTLQSDAYDHLNDTDETGFLHQYAGGHPTPTPANRLTVAGGGNCGGPPTNGYYTNPDDSGFQSWLVTNAWTTATPNNFPTPYGIYEDHFAVVGGSLCDPSFEYGNAFCNMLGTSGSHWTHDWETALGNFENNAESVCSPCFPFAGN